jgi:hypothetical protein
MALRTNGQPSRPRCGGCTRTWSSRTGVAGSGWAGSASPRPSGALGDATAWRQEESPGQHDLTPAARSQCDSGGAPAAPWFRWARRNERSIESMGSTSSHDRASGQAIGGARRVKWIGASRSARRGPAGTGSGGAAVGRAWADPSAGCREGPRRRSPGRTAIASPRRKQAGTPRRAPSHRRRPARASARHARRQDHLGGHGRRGGRSPGTGGASSAHRLPRSAGRAPGRLRQCGS